jgi:hypothetical protein
MNEACIFCPMLVSARGVFAVAGCGTALRFMKVNIGLLILVVTGGEEPSSGGEEFDRSGEDGCVDSLAASENIGASSWELEVVRIGEELDSGDVEYG